jgi:hypothetical protein
MNRLRIATGIFSIVSLSLLNACNFDVTTGPGTVWFQPSARISISRTVWLFGDSSRIEDNVQAEFNKSESAEIIGIYGGYVGINDTPLEFAQHLVPSRYGDTVLSGVYYREWSDSASSPINFNGGTNSVRVIGNAMLSNIIPVTNFTRTMPPIKPPMLTSHAAGDTIDRSKPLTLVWEPQSWSDSYISIMVMRWGDDLESIGDEHRLLSVGNLPDTGSYTFDLQAITGLVPDGRLSIMIERTTGQQEWFDDHKQLSLWSSATLHYSMYLSR